MCARNASGRSKKRHGGSSDAQKRFGREGAGGRRGHDQDFGEANFENSERSEYMNDAESYKRENFENKPYFDSQRFSNKPEDRGQGDLKEMRYKEDKTSEFGIDHNESNRGAPSQSKKRKKAA